MQTMPRKENQPREQGKEFSGERGVKDPFERYGNALSKAFAEYLKREWTPLIDSFNQRYNRSSRFRNKVIIKSFIFNRETDKRKSKWKI